MEDCFDCLLNGRRNNTSAGMCPKVLLLRVLCQQTEPPLTSIFRKVMRPGKLLAVVPVTVLLLNCVILKYQYH